MSARALRTAALCAVLGACVAVDDGRREMTPSGGAGGAGGAGSDAGASARGGSGGEPSSPGGRGGRDAGLPEPDVDAIFQSGCATATVEAELPRVNLLFVLDRSESMICNPPPTTASADCEARPDRDDPEQKSKWEITRNALTTALRDLPPEIVVGISYFSNDDACGVHSRPRIPLRALTPAQIAAIDASLASVTPNGATPLVGATILAYRHLHEAALRGTIRGERFVVLLTDGEQSEGCVDASRCADKQRCTELLVDEEVGKASGPGVQIRTFVIGVPGSEPAREVLSRIALRGGTAPAGCSPGEGNCHFDMSEEPDLGRALAGALEQIVGRALSCELPLPDAEALDRDRVNVVYSSSAPGVAPRVVPRDDARPCGDGANGWQYAPDGKTVQLCGAACNEARDDAAGRIDVVLGCPVMGPD